MTPFRLAILNLSRRKIPSLIAILSIAISVACSGILLRLNLVSQNRFSTLAPGADAIVGAKAGGIEIILGALNGEGDYPGFLPMKLFDSLRSEQAVHFEDGAESKPSYLRIVIPFVYFAKFDGYRIAGTDETFIKRTDGPHLKEGTWAANPGEVVIGSILAQSKNLKVGDSISILPWAGSQAMPQESLPMKVVGVLDAGGTSWDRMGFSNLQSAHRVLQNLDLRRESIWGADVLNYFLIDVNPDGFQPLATLVNRRTVGEAILVSQQKARLADLSGTGTKIGLFVTILILALGGLAVTSMLITRFDAMSLQLAVLRALGYKKSAIGRWLLWEGFLLGIAACALGIAFDWVGFPLMRGLLGDALPSADLVQSSILQSFPIWVTAIAATTASVFIPLYRVYHQDVHFSLRA